MLTFLNITDTCNTDVRGCEGAHRMKLTRFHSLNLMCAADPSPSKCEKAEGWILK